MIDTDEKKGIVAEQLTPGPSELVDLFRSQVCIHLDDGGNAMLRLEGSPMDFGALETLIEAAEAIRDLAMIHGFEDIEALASEIHLNARKAHDVGSSVTPRWRQNVAEALRALEHLVVDDPPSTGEDEGDSMDEIPGDEALEPEPPSSRFDLEEPSEPRPSDPDPMSSLDESDAGPAASEVLFDIAEDDALWQLLDPPDREGKKKQQSRPEPPSLPVNAEQAPGREPTKNEEDQLAEEVLTFNPDFPRSRRLGVSPPKEGPPAGAAESEEDETEQDDLVSPQETRQNGSDGGDDEDSPPGEIDLFEQILGEDLEARLKTLRLLTEELVKETAAESLWQHIFETLRGLRDNAYKLDVREIHTFTKEFIKVIQVVCDEPNLKTSAAVEIVRCGTDYYDSYLRSEPELVQKRDESLGQFDSFLEEARQRRINRPPGSEQGNGKSGANKNGSGLGWLRDLLTKRIV